MKFSSRDIESLERLAHHLETKAAVCAAKATEHRGHKEHTEAEREDNRGTSALYYVGVLRRVTRQMREKDAPENWNAPTIEEVKAYVFSFAAAEKLPHMPLDEIASWYDHFQSNGWKVSGKTVMKDWKGAARNGFRRWLRDRLRAHGTVDKTASAIVRDHSQDPEGWRTFLGSKGKPYKPFKVALDHLKEEFQRSKA